MEKACINSKYAKFYSTSAIYSPLIQRNDMKTIHQWAEWKRENKRDYLLLTLTSWIGGFATAIVLLRFT